MWAGRFAKELNKEADDFNSSIHFDCKMYKQDITGSMKHATMLAMQKIITDDDCDKILAGLQSILDDLDSGALKFDMDAEDIHMFVESELTKRIGDVGKKLHTARSRNDQVALDMKLYIRDEVLGYQQRTVSVAQKPEIMAQCIIINPSPVSFHKGGNQ